MGFKHEISLREGLIETYKEFIKLNEKILKKSYFCLVQRNVEKQFFY